MKVILLEEVRGKGGEGDVVEVARGFANNYLLKKRLAIKATPGNLKQLEQRRKNIAKREEVRINSATTRKGQLEALKVVIATRVGEEGQLFGSVTAPMIADAIKEQGNVEVDRRRIDVRVPIKTVGEHEVEISLYREIKATVKIEVIDEKAAAEEAEAETAEEAVEAAEGAEAEAEVEVEAAAEPTEPAVAPVAPAVPAASAPAVPAAPAAPSAE